MASDRAAHDDRSADVARERRRAAEGEAGHGSPDFGEYLHATFDEMFEGVQIIDFDWRYVYLNTTAASQGRVPRDQLIGRTMMAVYPGIEQTELFDRLTRCMQERVPQRMINEFTYPDGRTAWFDLRITPVPMGVLVLSIDISEAKAAEQERKRAEQAIRESEARFRQVTEHIKEVFFLLDLATGKTLYVSRAFEEIWGLSVAHAYANPSAWLDAVHPDDRPAIAASLDATRRGEPSTLTYRLVRPDGSTRWMRGRTSAVRDDAGRVYRVVGVAEDITQERELEGQFRQAQKMEAVGRLAGGVAHDFNNLLTAISGYADLVTEQLPPDGPLQEDMAEIRKAAERAATLTRQLLAFSRQQVLAPRVLGVNDLVHGIEKMLHRVLGEDVELAALLGPDAGNVKADPGQLEQVLVNLAVNARDAMPGGGKLTIETAAVEIRDPRSQEFEAMTPGRYVLLAVSDTGTGMDEGTKAKIFEPFFTTKAPGQGTGLGLSTVYGIVRQSGGFIWVYSEPGHGTTFKIYLPRADQPAEVARPSARRPAPRGSEVVLLVEDEETVRTLAVRALTRQGYDVLSASDGAEAVRLCEEHGSRIRLLVTDLVMPGMGGADLARHVRARCPGLAVLFISGYADRAAARHGSIEPGAAYLDKPFTPDALARKVREVLDRTG